ncbi:MAG: ferrous iron transport protein A [Bacteroidota bacterium]|nr:MAG: ferrous iron transport protein A [Bacteroidota bacterium]
MKTIKLTELPFRQKARIHSFGETELYVKLLEMGCIPNEEISVELTAPLGDPIAIQVAGYQLSLRKEEAEHILVEPIVFDNDEYLPD